MPWLRSFGLMLVLINPFLLVIYLIDVIGKLDQPQFRKVMIRATWIAGIIFCCFALLGDAIFSSIVQADFASFQIFGGVVFLIIGLQFVFNGPSAIEMLRGESEYLVGAIAMPIFVGPGSISVSILIGRHHSPGIACLIIMGAVLTSGFVMVLLKKLHDFVRPRQEKLIRHYIEVAGRITALYIGTVSVEMIMQGLQTWIQKF